MHGKVKPWVRKCISSFVLLRVITFIWGAMKTNQKESEHDLFKL